MMREGQATMTSVRVKEQSEEQEINAIAQLRGSGFFAGQAFEHQAAQRRR